jgi:G3E family GTPase
MIIWLVGTPGSAKTTLIKNTLERATLQGRVMAIVNDGGTPETVDAAVLEKYGTVATMANGCFTCQDRGGLEILIENSLPHFDLVIIEGFGFTSGRESRTAAREIAQRFGMQYEIVCVFDALHLAKNLQCFGEILASQLQAATSAVIVTKLEQPLEDAEEVRQIIAHNTRVPMFATQRDAGITVDMITRVQGSVRVTPIKHSCCDHDHAHDHGATAYAIDLRSDVSVEQIRRMLEALADHGLLRAKGAVQNLHFDWVHGTFEVTWEDQRSFLTAYFSHPTAEWEMLVSRVQKPLAENLLGHDTLSLMRHDRNLPIEQRTRIAQELIDTIPSAAIVHGGTILTHPEPLQVAKEFCRQPEIKQLVWHEFIGRACAYWLACVELSNKNQDLQTAVMMRELGISLCWWVSENEAVLGNDFCARIISVTPWELALRGFKQLKTTHVPPETSSDVDQGFWQALEFERAAHLARKHGCTLEDYSNCASSVALLYRQQRPTYLSAITEWQRVADNL